ncbi:hypothetical protein KR054_010782 [Drosophila jambulina]|nr:hypothetical protein KR054_010782 [Drosophila jambulina]
MPSKKHLDSQGRRRTNRRRAVQLSEFLRGDEESTVQLPVPLAESQNTNESSIGTISSTGLPGSCVAVSTPVSPEAPTEEAEKVAQSPASPAAPPMPVNAWQLPSGENDPPQGTFMPDHKAFPDLGKQVKKAKALAVPEASMVTKSLDSAKARRGCPVLGNFLPESLLPDGAAGKDPIVANGQGNKQASCSPPRITILKRATSLQPKSSGCGPMLPEIRPFESATKAAVALDAVSALENGPYQQKEQQKQPEKSPESFSERNIPKKGFAGPSRQQMSENPYRRETNPLVKFQAGEEYVVTASRFPSEPEISPVAVPALGRGSSQQKEQLKQAQKSPGSFLEKLQQKCPAGSSNQKMPENPYRREANPLVKFQVGEEYVVPASQFSAQVQVQRQSLSSFWEESDDSALEEHTVEQVLPPIRRSLLNANAQEFRPMFREQEWEQEQLYPTRDSSEQLPESRLKRRRRAQRSNRSMKRWQVEHTNCGGQAFENENQDPAQGQMSQQGAVQAQRQRQGAGQQQPQEQHQISLHGCYYNSHAAHQRQQQQAVTLAQRQLHQGNQQVYPVYVAAPTAPAAYGAPSAPPVYVATPFYAAPPATSAASPFFAPPPAASAAQAIDYVAAPATPNYGGYVSISVIPESLACPYLWAMQ